MITEKDIIISAT